MEKVELLAPAGSYESFLGAIHAGADAVYLGGAKFGARAYADNFTEEEVCMAIRYAHIYGKKVYLTLNTLIKEREFVEIYEYLFPFYKCGLDGVIIQDLGAFHAVGEWFPGLERHISTQMTVTGALGAAGLKAMGATRIVPARELSLEEIRQIKEETDIEIETFVHGAVCYCYSGQCLFSSILGGRSGNRGRCAQPCRLPYGINSTGRNDLYPLSLKDMCTIELLPELIEAGINSFKIEGRMKSPEYTAGVTAIYRKYIDRYYCCPEAAYEVEHNDMEMLRALYIRSEISEGYYHRHNGREMITLKSPGYAGRDDSLAAHIRKKYLESDFRIPVNGTAVLTVGERARLTVDCDGVTVTAAGDVVQQALKQPLTEESVFKQLNKSGNTAFVFKKLSVEISSDAFMPVKLLNDLRRSAFEMLEEKMIEKNGLCCQERKNIEKTAAFMSSATDMVKYTNDEDDVCNSIHVFAMTKEQCRTAFANHVQRIYISSDLCIDILWLKEIVEQTRKDKKTEFYLALPYIIRQRDEEYLLKMKQHLKNGIFSGILVRNLEEIRWYENILQNGEITCDVNIVSDANLYIWNREAYKVLEQFSREHYVPYELNIHEIRELMNQTETGHFAMSIYGRIPMMVTANCVAATCEGCRKGSEKEKKVILTDRYNKTFPVYLNCIHCYNVIYNSLPLSLHQNIDKIKNAGIHTFRLDFTTEIGNDVDKIICYFKDLIAGKQASVPYEEYTKGHFKRGAE